ncbi:MAG: CoA transferase [Chloroflexota bacterium]|nr:MAG: CoA transferase [Chloroflexota bacterium]
MGKHIFQGLKALGFCNAGVGTLVLRILATHGATVVRVESESSPDVARTLAPFKDNVPGLNRSYYYNFQNSDKYSLALNMKHPRKDEVTKRLVEWADVLVENFTPGVMAKWNLSYEEVKKINPSIIMISLSMQGQTGPARLQGGYGGLLQSLAGYPLITGWPDGLPNLIDRSYPDFIAPRFGATAVIAALLHRRRTGQGQYIDVSQYEDVIQFEIPVILDWAVNRRLQTRLGNKFPLAAPHGTYRCKGDDRWCAIAVFSDSEWESLCRVMGNPEWTTQPEYASHSARKQNEDELNELVEAWTANHTAEEVMSLMQQAGVKAGVVQTIEDVVEHDPQLKHRQFFWKTEHPECGDILHSRPNYILSKTPSELRMPPPLLGEHTEYVCRELLQMSEDEFTDLLLDDVLT